MCGQGVITSWCTIQCHQVVLVEMGDPPSRTSRRSNPSHVGHHEALIRALDVGLDSHWPVELVELASRI